MHKSVRVGAIGASGRTAAIFPDVNQAEALKGGAMTTDAIHGATKRRKAANSERTYVSPSATRSQQFRGALYAPLTTTCVLVSSR